MPRGPDGFEKTCTERDGVGDGGKQTKKKKRRSKPSMRVCYLVSFARLRDRADEQTRPNRPSLIRVIETAFYIDMIDCYFVDSTHSNNWRNLRIHNADENLAYIEYDPTYVAPRTRVPPCPWPANKSCIAFFLFRSLFVVFRSPSSVCRVKRALARCGETNRPPRPSKYKPPAI